MAARAGGGGAMVALIVGALVVAVIGIGWMVWSGRTPALAPADLAVDIRIPEPPNLPRPAPMPEPQPAPLPLPTPPQPR
ncbi:MAG: hypothetical protein Q8J89_01010 [Caulobacter sp.]|nr:hypothetical protein [Caulobacter sp.]